MDEVLYHLTLDVLPGRFAICRLGVDAAIPDWATGGRLFSVTRTPSELSVLCEEEAIPREIRSEVGWRALMVRGQLDFNLTGILSGLTVPLAEDGISLFAVSTYDTDYIFVRDRDLDRAVTALRLAGHEIATDG